MDSKSLEALYRSYIAVLNTRRFDDLHEFVHDSVTHNGRTMTVREYGDMIAGEAAAVDNLVFDVRMLLAADDRVACRIHFECTPLSTFLGFRPTGRKVQFAEHVWYRFEEGRIREVWSLIDKEAVRRQLEG